MKERQTIIKGKSRQRSAAMRKRLTEARLLVRKRVPATVSLVDELIAERCEESRRESDRH
jgi:hypothetical protein